MNSTQGRIAALFTSSALLITVAVGCGDLAEAEGYLTVNDPDFFGGSHISSIFRGGSSQLVEISVRKCKNSYEDPSDHYDESSRHRAYLRSGDQDSDDRQRESYVRESEINNAAYARRCAHAYDYVLSFPTRATSLMSRIFNVRCANVNKDGTYRCIGDDDGLAPHLAGGGPVKYVALIKGSRLLGFQVWQMKPPASSGRGAPYPLAWMGEHRGFRP